MSSSARNERLSSEALITQVNHGIYQFGNALSAVFLNVYLWRLTNDLWINGAFNLIVLLSGPVATMYIGKVAKLKDRLLAYRLGIFLTAVLYLCIFIVQEGMVEHYVWFALLRGVSTAFYWLGHFTLISEVTNNENRHRYLGWNQIITNVATLAGPAVAGMLIGLFEGLQGYTYIYLLAFLMFLLSSLVSLKLKKAESHHRTYYLKYTGQMIRKYRIFGRSLGGWFVMGLPQGIMGYVPTIILYQAVPKESFVGWMNMAFTGIMILSGYFLAKKAKSEQTQLFLWLSAWGFVVASLPLLGGITLWTVIFFMSVFSFVKPLQTNVFTAHYYKMSSELPLGPHYRVEAVVVRETSINLGRATGVILFMLTSGHPEWMPWILVLVMSMQLAVNTLINPNASGLQGKKQMAG